MIVVTVVNLSPSLDNSGQHGLSRMQDLPNHGERLKDRNANLAFDKNPRHLYVSSRGVSEFLLTEVDTIWQLVSVSIQDSPFSRFGSLMVRDSRRMS